MFTVPEIFATALGARAPHSALVTNSKLSQGRRLMDILKRQPVVWFSRAQNNKNVQNTEEEGTFVDTTKLLIVQVFCAFDTIVVIILITILILPLALIV